jgi:hypothetical protein
LGVPRRRIPLRNPYTRSTYPDMEGTPAEQLAAINGANTPDAMADALLAAERVAGVGPGIRQRIRSLATVYGR